MRTNYFPFVFSLVFSSLLFFSDYVQADAPLKKQLGLGTEQARQVQEIQKGYRKKFSAKRGELHRETRKLRRARSANDSETIAQQEKITLKLQEELKQIRLSENQEIRGVLTPEQGQKFEQILKERAAVRGSSRNEREL